MLVSKLLNPIPFPLSSSFDKLSIFILSISKSFIHPFISSIYASSPKLLDTSSSVLVVSTSSASIVLNAIPYKK